MAVTIPRDAPPWAQTMVDDITRELRARVRGFPVVLAAFNKVDLPDASRWVGSWIFVRDDVGGPIPAFSDGTAWKRCTDGAVVS
jgi:hypothetical protein